MTFEEIKQVIDAVTEYHRATSSYPASIPGQQIHFSVTLPMLEAKAVEALCFVLGHEERETLRDLLNASLGETESDD